MAKTTQTDDTNTEATVTPEVVKLPAVKEPELTFSAPDDNGTRWAEKKEGDRVRVYGISKEGRQINTADTTAAKAKAALEAYLKED
ncbi:hypothetical protein GCM10008955_01210 [Deinococcus malanensis]|uniref:Uncharacterized protein n=1 Tax=Deinococcus malanensis TaxID=1706855 RepID=A0ABQ2EJF4_9DEIO|nr:hypothetical protein [Deinococcus malanensis]GGK11730.1 hypothetical protein GCM10008955_01210 [Deinococcus malanensis]